MFEMALPTGQCNLGMLGLINDDFKQMGKSKYSINAAGEVEWIPTKTMQSFYMTDPQLMAHYLRFHEREEDRPPAPPPASCAQLI